MHLARTFTRAKCLAARVKRGISTRGTPALATWASEKARCGAGGARTLPCERAVCRCSRCACHPATRSTASSLTPPSRSARTPLLRQRVQRAATHIRRCWCIRDAATYTRCVRWLVEPGGSAARAIVLCGKQLPAVVLMRGGGRRCVWSVDAVSGLSARVLEDKIDWMPGRREGLCMGCGWDMVVVG
jgi:hypothetical protein